jgi:hypothetical protein
VIACEQNKKAPKVPDDLRGFFMVDGIGVNAPSPVSKKKTVMNRSFSFVAALFLLLSCTFTACYRDAFGVDGAGPTNSETRTPGTFDGVDAGVDADVYLHYDSVCRVEVSAQSNVLHVLKTVVHGSTLDIEFSRNVHSHSTITIHVYAPNFVRATLSGSGTIHNSNALLNGNFHTSISGSGTIDLYGLQAGAVTAAISGSGSIRLSGQAQSLRTETSGSGDTHTFDLIVQDGDVKISGSGNVEINASQTLDVRISGSGDVYYKNNPAMDVDISGSGNVHHVN